MVVVRARLREGGAEARGIICQGILRISALILERLKNRPGMHVLAGRTDDGVQGAVRIHGHIRGGRKRIPGIGSEGDRMRLIRVIVALLDRIARVNRDCPVQETYDGQLLGPAGI